MTKNKIKWILIGILIFIICVPTINYLLKFVAAGSYPFAELYTMKVKESVLIDKINEFKQKNPQFIPPQVLTSSGAKKFNLQDHRKDSTDYWYHVYFYYPQENLILACWTRPLNDSVTTFAFVGINNGLILGQWKEVNDGYGYFENKKVIKQFEERILNKIKESINEK